jgi:carbon monoxide dehydrogenase subunit G
VKIVLSEKVPASRERVFAALVDPEILRRSIPGCESMIATGPDAPDVYEARLNLGIAGFKGAYRGTVAIREQRAPDSLKLTFEGKGGPGFVLGQAAIALSEQDASTRVTCDADVQVGGLIAAVGSRLVEAAARKLAADFFSQLSRELTQDEAAARS